MEPRTPADVGQLLSEYMESDLVHLKESHWLDFKLSPYVLDQSAQKFELGKDVASMASNPEGGCILLGVKAIKDTGDLEERAEEIIPFPCHLIDEQRYRDVIRSFVYPPVRGLAIHRYKRGGKCLALIVIPPQEEDNKPFLVSRIVDAEGGEVQAFGLPSRDGSHTYWAPIGVVHRDLADGKRLRRMPALNATPEGIKPNSHESFEIRLGHKVDELERYMGWTDTATFTLAAEPRIRHERIDGFFDDRGLKGAFARPRGLRNAGFGIGYPREPLIEEGALVAVDGDFRVRWLEPDGFLSVAVRTDEDFLCRTRNPTGEPHSLPLNLVALVEFALEFCRFQAETMAHHVSGQWDLGVSIRGALTRPWRPVLSIDEFSINPQPASSDNWVRILQATGEPPKDAFALVARTFDLFGVSDSWIPYATDRQINIEEIAAL